MVKSVKVNDIVINNKNGKQVKVIKVAENSGTWSDKEIKLHNHYVCTYIEDTEKKCVLDLEDMDYLTPPVAEEENED